mgnify:CR=1 FL=1
MAVPYDLFVSGYNSEAVSKLRLWKAEMADFDMSMFNQGDYQKALSKNIISQAITKVLYPNDNHAEGKSLRLRQQYFLCAASIGDIVNQHMSVYGTLDNLHEKVAIHINDTHPTLAIPELMRVLLDDCGYSWDKAWHIVTNTFAYTNHTVMPEALEKWDCNLLKSVCPRIFSIIIEINERYCKDLWERYKDQAKVSHMSIVEDNKVKMATLCVHACHSVNGVAKIHSEIIKKETFKDEYLDTPTKFKNVTNGIAYRRWLYQSNEGLTDLLCEKIGDGFLKNAAELSKLAVFKDDKDVLDRLAKIKLDNKKNFAKYVKNQYGVVLNTDSIFDVQVKRLHEYKRQQLNALYIIDKYLEIKEGILPKTPITAIFGAKAAPAYVIAKDIIHLILCLQEIINNDPEVSPYLKVVMVENYNVTKAEKLIPACDISEQISLASKEASGTGNMKFMLNGAVTLGTGDGANVEIHELVGDDNIFVFGASSDEVIEHYKKADYSAKDYYKKNPKIKAAVDFITGKQMMKIGCKESLERLQKELIGKDWFMTFLDFDAYKKAKDKALAAYTDQKEWAKKMLVNIAEAGYFSSDRTIEQYNRDIWKLTRS